MTRYIVLGTHRGISDWRRENHVSPRDVIPVTSSYALRGLGPGEYRLVRTSSWRPTPEEDRDVRESLRAIEAHGGKIER